jgi:hypothetical protein
VLKFDATAASFTGWQAGENEVIVALRNPTAEDSPAGGFAFRMELIVPEPSGVTLVLLGFLGMMGVARPGLKR